jgi:hypothetical protein
VGQTPDEIRDEIAATRERMTETIRVVALKADAGKRIGARLRRRRGPGEGSVNGALDSLGGDVVLGDLDAGAGTVEPKPELSGTVSPGSALRRNGPLLASLAGAAAGVLVGLGTMRSPRARRADSESSAS